MIASLRGLPELRPDVWDGLDKARRLEALQKAERLIAAAMGRAACDVRTYDASPEEAGYFNGLKNAIYLASDSLEQDAAPEVVATLVHEARHAYQAWCIKHPGVHPDNAEVEAWRRNMSNYVDPAVDERAYFAQPIEVDAYAFEEAVERGVYGGSDDY
ncbi:MAG: hypothetical protein M3Q29_23905 [Chloroflexota bacterium]|nr:hypothetical protein [Chloroflexota bacterium]